MKLRKIGKKEICMVIRVDEENGYIDLSKKRVPTDTKVVDDKYAKGKLVRDIMRSIYEATKVPIPKLYETIVYPLQKSGKHALDIFLENLE